jgi:hypothetical protein
METAACGSVRAAREGIGWLLLFRADATLVPRIEICKENMPSIEI